MKHTGPLSEHDARNIAKQLRAAADMLDDGYRRGGPIRKANEWFGYLRAAAGGVRGDTSDPTGETATNPHQWPAELAALIGAHARLAYDAAASLCQHIARAAALEVDPADPTVAASLDRLDEANRRAGDCDCCGRTCLGDRGDRLTTTVIAWTTWANGSEREHRHERTMCAACRASWTRAKDRGGDFDTWERHRRNGLDSEDVA